MDKIVIALLIALLTPRYSVVWGGEHVEMQVTDRGASIEFDCAHGTLDAALAPDANGRFTIAGTFTPERSRSDNPPLLKARYAGTIKEEAMSLTVTLLVEDAPAPMTYELMRGRAGVLRKCR